MAKPPKNLDRLTPELRRDVAVLGGEPDFVDFALAWYGLLGSVEAKGPDTWAYWDSSRQRQVKRELVRTHGPQDGKIRWLARQAQAKSYRAPLLQADLFGIDISNPNPGNRPFAWKFWLALRDVKTYLIKLTGRPHWNLLAAIFFPEADYDYAQAEWVRREKRFASFDPRVSLAKLTLFYDTFKPVILSVLSSRIPISISPHREQVETILASIDLNEFFAAGVILSESR